MSRLLSRTVGSWCPCGDCGAQPTKRQLRARGKRAWRRDWGLR